MGWWDLDMVEEWQGRRKFHSTNDSSILTSYVHICYHAYTLRWVFLLTSDIIYCSLLQTIDSSHYCEYPNLILYLQRNTRNRSLNVLNWCTRLQLSQSRQLDMQDPTKYELRQFLWVWYFLEIELLSDVSRLFCRLVPCINRQGQ